MKLVSQFKLQAKLIGIIPFATYLKKPFDDAPHRAVCILSRTLECDVKTHVGVDPGFECVNFIGTLLPEVRYRRFHQPLVSRFVRVPLVSVLLI